MHPAHHRAAGGDAGGAEEDRAADTGRTGPFQEGQHDGGRVGGPDGRHEIDPGRSSQGGVVGGGVVPVEADGLCAGQLGGTAGGGSDGVPECGEPAHDAAAGVAGGAGDQDGVVAGPGAVAGPTALAGPGGVGPGGVVGHGRSVRTWW